MKWLHISDVHFTNLSYSTDILRSSLIKALKDMNTSLDFILVTGDCFYKNKNSRNTIKDLKSFITEIERACNTRQNHLYICQGNHDIDRNNQERNKCIDRIRTESSLNITDYNSVCDLGGENFQALFLTLRNKVYDDYIIMEPRNLNVRIVSINTCILSKDDNDYRQLRVCTNKLNELSSKLKDDEKLNILMMHHGIEWLHPDDARSFEHWIEDNHIDVIFCGHTHQAAVANLNDVNREILQFTAGALVIDNYAIPSFYLCENTSDSITVSLYTFSGKTEKWSLDTVHLRKFHNGGKHTFRLSRHVRNAEKRQLLDNINIYEAFSCDQIIAELNNKYFKKFNSTKMFSNKSGENEEFNAWKIVGSLASVDIPYSTALKLACKAVEEITSDDYSCDNIIESSDLKQIIYTHILRAKSYFPNLNEYEISSWANDYNKHFDKEKGYVMIEGNRRESISYGLLNSSIIKEVIIEITGNEIYYSKIYKNERQRMASQIMRFIKSLNIFEIDKKVLLPLIVEFVTKSPRYWFVSNNRTELINYHIKEAERNIYKIEQEDNPLLQTEAAYHLFSAFLVKYDEYIGCSMISPIKILTNSINRLGTKDDKNLPMRRYKLVQLKKDLENSGISIKEFTDNVNCIYDNFVTNKCMTSEDTASSLIALLNDFRKIPTLTQQQWKSGNNTFDAVLTLFKDGEGIVVRKPLKSFDEKAFFVSAYWDDYQRNYYNLGTDILVCMLSNNSTTDANKQYCDSLTFESIIEYLSQRKRRSIRELCMFKDTFVGFTQDERKQIRSLLSKNHINVRCVFLQITDTQLVYQFGWREEFFKVICKSRFS